MSVVINGDTGISGVDGSAANPAIKGTDADTGIHFGTNTAAITTGGTERVSVDSSGAATFSGTVKTSKVENANTSNGGVEIDSDGHIQIDGVQMPNAGALGHRNIIVNGSMNVAQRATSKTTAVASYHTVDRLKISPSDSQTQSQISLTSADTPFTKGLRKAFRLQNSTVSSAGDSTYREIDYRIEAQDIAQSGWNHTDPNSFITISFWLRASVAQSYYLYLRAFHGTAQAYACELAVAANTWTKFEKTIPGNANLTINSDNSAGLLIRFLPWYATTYTGSGAPLNAWQPTSTDYVPDMSNTWVTTLNATFDITGFQVEAGKKATEFEHRNTGEELARCQRYFQAVPWTNGLCATATQVHANYSPVVEMRAGPSLGQQGVFDVNDNSTNATQSGVNVISYGDGKIKFVQIGSFTGLTTHRPCFMRFSGDPSNNNLLTLDAEL